MASQEFNLSVLENTATFSTPLKDRSDYEAILSLIKEEIDIAQTEDEADYHKSAKKSHIGVRRKESELCDSEGVFKSPYKRNCSVKSKSPGNALFPRTIHRSHLNARNNIRRYAPPRAKSLGHPMPGRSLQLTYRKHRSSISHSDTSGFSDHVEKIINRENRTAGKNLENEIKKEIETEENALDNLLTTAREQVIVNGRPFDENSTLSSQGDSTSLATTDPLDTGTMEESYVESSQSVALSDLRQKLLNHRSSIAEGKPKTAEMIKKNLHFDATESEEENQHFSLTLSPEPRARFNGDRDASSTPPFPRKRKESQDSTSSTSKNLTPQRPRERKTSHSIITSSLKSLTRDLQSLDFKREASATPPRPSEQKTCQDSANSSASTLKNLTQDLKTFDPKSETETTPQRSRDRKTSQSSIASSHKSLTYDLQNLDPTKEASVASSRPRKRKTSQSSTIGSEKSLIQELSNLDPAKEASFKPSHPRKSQTKIVSSRKNLTKDQSNADISKEPILIPPRPIKRKKKETTIGSSLKSSTQDLTNLDPKRDASAAAPHQEKKITGQEAVSNRAKDSTDLDSNREASATQLRPKKKKKSEKIASTRLQKITHLDRKRKASLTPPRLRRRKSSITSPLKGLTQELEDCIMNNDFEQMCEDIDNDMDTPSFTFETVQLLDEYDDSNQHANNKILSKILFSPNSKRKEDVPMNSEHYDPLYIAEDEDSEGATASTSKRKKSTGGKKKTNNGKISVADTSKLNKTHSNTDDTLEQGRRRSSTRSKKKRVTMTISDWEDDGNLSDEAAKVAKKVKAARKKERLSLNTLEKLDNIVVELRDKALPQHEIENRAGSAPLTYKQQMQFLEFASINKNTYSPAEDQIIKKNWNEFCEDHDWNPEHYKPFLHFKHGNDLIMSCLEQRRRFVQFLANGLPNRPLFSVYSRFKILYQEYHDSGTRYTPKEDKKILAYMLHNRHKQPDTKCSELAKVLKRSRFSIWKRYQNLTEKENCGKKKKKKKEVLAKVTWDLPLLSEFVTTLLDVTISEELTELKDAFIPKVVWQKLEQKIGIHYEFLRRSWDQQFHLQFFCPELLSSNATKIRLIEYMWMKGIRHSKEIEWPVVVKYFDGCTIPFLRKMFNHLTAQASLTLDSRNLSDILKWLHTTKIDRLRRDPKDKCLPRLRYENKKVELVPEDLMKLTSISTSVSFDSSTNLF